MKLLNKDHMRKLRIQIDCSRSAGDYKNAKGLQSISSENYQHFMIGDNGVPGLTEEGYQTLERQYTELNIALSQ